MCIWEAHPMPSFCLTLEINSGFKKAWVRLKVRSKGWNWGTSWQRGKVQYGSQVGFLKMLMMHQILSKLPCFKMGIYEYTRYSGAVW